LGILQSVDTYMGCVYIPWIKNLVTFTIGCAESDKDTQYS